MGISNNEDVLNKIPLKSVTDDEEKNGGEFIHDAATAEEARREQRKVVLLNVMKKLTMALLCFIGIALISYIIISLCFSDWPKSTSTNPNRHHKKNVITSNTRSTTSATNSPATIPLKIDPTSYTSNTGTISSSNNPPPPPSASPLLSLPSISTSSFLSDDNNTTKSATAEKNTLTNATVAASIVGQAYEVSTDIATLTETESTLKTPAIKSDYITKDAAVWETTTAIAPDVPLLTDVPILEENFTSKLGIFQNAAVCSDKPVCSQIGSNILEEGGSAVDSAIATLLCVGVTTLQSMGIGGGMLMNIYVKSHKQAYSVDAREVAPFASTEDMFNGNNRSSMHGGLSIAVPGELMGYERAHNKFGKLPWKKLVEPSLKLCKEGFYMTKHMKKAYSSKFNRTKSDEILRKVFINETTENIHPVGTKLFPLPELCHSYELLAANGPYDFYNGTLSKLVAEDLKDLGSLVTHDDLESYRADLVSSVTMQLGSDILYAVPPISSGTIVANILSILESFNFTQADMVNTENRATTMHRIVEALKFGFAKRFELGDMRFNDVRELVSRLTNPETGIHLQKLINDSTVLPSFHEYGAQFYGVGDKGTSPLIVMAANGDAVAVTSSINDYFGSGQVGKRTGIIFNSAMDDFSISGRQNNFKLPPSPSNIVAQQKRPMSSMSPMILTDQKSNVRMAVSAAGGTKIISSIVEVIARVLWFNENIKEAIDAPRIHNQLLPNIVEYESNPFFSEELLKLIADKGHVVKGSTAPGAVVCGMVKNETAIYANADYRKQGGVAGY